MTARAISRSQRNLKAGLSSSLVADSKIELIGFIPLVMPLPKTFRCSFYFMTHRRTIVTRIYAA
jgi:hypothetical protein